MFREIGLRFSVNGFQEAASQLQQFSSSFNNLSNSVSGQAPKVGKSMDAISGHTKRMATAVSANLKVAAAAFAAFAAGKTLMGFGQWMGGASDVGKNEDYLRQMGADDKRIEGFRKLSKALGRQIAGIDKADFMKAMYDVQSLHADEGMGQMESVGTTMGFLSKKLRSTVEDATDFYKVLYKAFGESLPEAQKKAFHGDVLSGVGTLLEKTAMKPEELKLAMRQLGPMYATEGKKWVDVLADMAAVIPSMGSERGSTALRNLAGRKGEMFGKLEEAVQRIKYENLMGDKFRNLSEENQKKFMAGKGWNLEEAADYGAELEKRSPAAFWKKFSDHIETIKAGGGDWMGKLKEALGEETFAAVSQLANSWKSGARQKAAKDIEASMNPEATKKGITDSQQSFASQYELFTQKIAEFAAGTRRFIQPLAVDIFKTWGDTLDKINSTIDMAMSDAGPKFRAMIEAFKNAFSDVFGDKAGALSGLDTWISNMLESLKEGTAGWQSLGQEIGRITGENLKGILDTLKSMAGLAERLNEALKWLGFKTDSEKKADATNPVEAAKSNWLSGATAGFLKKGLTGAVVGGLAGNTELGSSPLANALFSAITGTALGAPLGPTGAIAGGLSGGILGYSSSKGISPGTMYSNVNDTMMGVPTRQGGDSYDSSRTLSTILNDVVSKVQSLIGSIEVKTTIEGDTEVIKRVATEVVQNNSSGWKTSLDNWAD